jgi:hypothetical protein
MYPAQGLIDGEYGIDDLPDTIIVWIESTILNKAAEAFPSPSVGDLLVYYEGSYLIDGESYLIEVGLFDGIWRTWDERFFEELYTNDCLITSLILKDELIQDEFADSYTMSGGPLSFSVTVTRVSLCIWRGEDGCGNMAYLVYGDDSSLPFAGTDYEWSVALPFYDPTLVCENIAGFTVNGKENQNTPAGVYESIPGQPLGQTITVS